MSAPGPHIVHIRERERADKAERELEELRSALSDAVDAFEENASDYVLDIVADRLERWRSLIETDKETNREDG